MVVFDNALWFWSLAQSLFVVGLLKHKFTSGKAAAADPTLVDGVNWDDEHTWAGGSNDQVITRDSVQPDGAKWDWPKIRETGGPTTLTPGAIADGQALRRSGSAVIGEPITQVGAANSLLKTDASGRARLGADPSDVLDAATKQYVDALTAALSLTPLGAAIPATAGAVLVRVDATSETFYVLQFVDAGTREVTWVVPAKKITTVRVHWRSGANTGDARFVVEVRDKEDTDLMGSGTVRATATLVDTAKATANQFNEASAALSYTPGANKRWMLIRLQRTPADAADTLTSDLDVLGAQLVA